MTASETATLIATVRMAWPHSNLGDNPGEVLAFWHSMLKDVAASDAEAAVREIAASGERFAPPVGVIVHTVAQRSVDAPDFDQAWAESKRLIRKFGLNQKPGEDVFSHPAVAAWALPAWRELCMGPAEGVDGDTTHKAQQRGAYQAAAARSRRDRALDIVGAPRDGGLRKLNPLAVLDPGPKP